MAAPFKLALRHYPRFLVNSSDTRRKLDAHCRCDAEVTLYRPPVRNVFGLQSDARAARNAKPQPLRLLRSAPWSRGRISARRRPSSARCARRVLPGATLDIVGRQGWGDDWRMLNTIPGVTLHGYQPAEQVKRLLDAADLFICTSHERALACPCSKPNMPVCRSSRPTPRSSARCSAIPASIIDPTEPVAAAARHRGRRCPAPDGARVTSRLRNRISKRWNALAGGDRDAVIDLIADLAGTSDGQPARHATTAPRERRRAPLTVNVRTPQPCKQTTSTTRHLDGLRIVAACAVVVLHYSEYIKDQPAGRFMIDHTRHFNLFVDLFFVVSGFVIARQYLERSATRRRRDASSGAASRGSIRCIWRHSLSIWSSRSRSTRLAQDRQSRALSVFRLPAQLLLLHAFDGERLTFNFPSWSLSAEMFCYLLFPAGRRHRRAAQGADRRCWSCCLRWPTAFTPNSTGTSRGPTGSTRAAPSGRCRASISASPAICSAIRSPAGRAVPGSLIAVADRLHPVRLVAVADGGAGRDLRDRRARDPARLRRPFNPVVEAGLRPLVRSDLLLLHAAHPGRDDRADHRPRLLAPALPDAKLLLVPVASPSSPLASVLSCAISKRRCGAI